MPAGFTSTATSTSCSPPPRSTPLTGLTSWKSRPKAIAICSSFGDDIVCRIEVDPAPFGRPDGNPGMRGVRANELRLALRRIGEQIAADIARGQAKRAQARDFEMCEILAYASLDPQHLLHRRCRICCACLVFEFAMDPRREVLHRFEEGAALGKAWPRKFVDVARWPDVSRRAGIADGFKSFRAKVRAELGRDVVPARRTGRARRAAAPEHPPAPANEFRAWYDPARW